MPVPSGAEAASPPRVLPGSKLEMSQPGSISQRRNSRSPSRLVPSCTTRSMRNSSSSVLPVRRCTSLSIAFTRSRIEPPPEGSPGLPVVFSSRRNFFISTDSTESS